MPNGKLRFAAVYGTAAVMGFTPQDVNAMSLWQFLAALDGYVAANTPDDGKLSTAEIADLGDWLEAKAASD